MNWQELFRRIGDMADEGIWIIDAHNETTFASATLAVLLRTSVPALQGRHFLSFFSSADKVKVLASIGRQARDGVNRLEVHLERGDGTLVHCQLALNPLFDASDTFVGSVAMVLDITERTAIRQKLLASEERYHTLVEELPIAAYTGPPGTDTPMSYVSPEIESLLGYSRARWTSDADLYNSIMHPDDYEEVTIAYALHLATGARFKSEHRVFAADGRVVWIRDEAVIVRDGHSGTVSEHGVIVDITERKRAEEALRHQALHDDLTKLPNRTLLLERLAQGVLRSTRTAATIALALIDLDRFKDINDTFGHDQGDLLLQEVAARMSSHLRASDTLARLGGDEFAVLLPDTDAMGAGVVIAKLLAALEQPFLISGSGFQVDASLGITFAPLYGSEAGVLLRQADAAMYVAKRAGGGSAVYEPGQSNESRHRLELLGELRNAIETDQLVLHYQPKVSCTDGALHSVEALVRWLHPSRGVISPGAFVPLAEQTGLMIPLTAWVLKRALEDLQTWEDAGLSTQVSVNVSARNLRDTRFVEDVHTVLAKSHVPAACLALEITESSIMTDPDGARIILDRLSEAGIEIVIDDFGTGYSSLSYLQQIPVDTLKIDRRFVTDMTRRSGDRVIVQATINLAHELGLHIVAEGVEGFETLDALRLMHCDLAQGFYIARPMPAGALQSWAEGHATG